MYRDALYGPLINQHGMQLPQQELSQHKVDNSRMYRDSVNAIQNAPYNDIIGDTQGYQAAMSRQAAQSAYEAANKVNDRFEALRQEKAENMVKISQLKVELAKLQSSLGDEDAFSRALAANRAKIGDLANSRAHQQDIANRFQWRWQADQAEKSRKADRELQNNKDKERLIGEIEDIDIVLASPQTDSQTRDAWEAKKKRKMRELKALGGEYGGVQTAPNGADGRKVMTVEGWKEKLSDLRKDAYKEMYLKQADIDMLRNEVEKWPDSEQKTAAKEELRKIKSEEKQKAGEAKYRKRRADAIAKAKAQYGGNKLPPEGNSLNIDGFKIEVKYSGGKNHFYIDGKEV